MKVLWWPRPVIRRRNIEGRGRRGAAGAEAECGADEGLDAPGGGRSGSPTVAGGRTGLRGRRRAQQRGPPGAMVNGPRNSNDRPSAHGST